MPGGSQNAAVDLPRLPQANAPRLPVWAPSSGPPAVTPILRLITQTSSPRATGGVGFTVAINAGGASTQYCNLLPGVGSWSCVSDRNAKENFVAAKTDQALERLVAMPLPTWSFKGADPKIRFLGPTAQDFYAAFELRFDGLTIASTNLHGVALAAIQGLHQVVQEKTRESRHWKPRSCSSNSPSKRWRPKLNADCSISRERHFRNRHPITKSRLLCFLRRMGIL